MTVVNLQEAVEHAVQDSLDALLGDDKSRRATFHVGVVPTLVWDEEDQTYTETMIWRLNIFMVTASQGRETYVNHTAALPFSAMISGDTTPIEMLAQRMYQDLAFGSIFTSNDLESNLAQVAAEVEGPQE